MSAFLPESDSEDELPPGWEERATLQGEVKSILSILFVGRTSLIKSTTGLLRKSRPVFHPMATPKDREKENSWRKLAIWLGEENSRGQQGPFLL